MANLTTDSTLSRRIVRSFLHFLNSVEPSTSSDIESLEVAKECLSEAFKVDSSSISDVPNSDSLVQLFSSQTGQNEIKSEQIHDKSRADTPHSSSTNKAPADTKTPEVHEDELFGQFFCALEKVHYFQTTPAYGGDEQLLDRATQLFHSALMEMKKSACEQIDLKNMAETFKLQGNSAMQARSYFEAIELYTFAITLRDDNAVYYSNRAAAYTQTNQHLEAVQDSQKAIAIDPNYSKAYSRLGFALYAQGKYREAIDKGFKKALELDPSNESVRGNIQAAEQKLREQPQRESSSSWNSFGSSNGSIPPFSANPPFSGIPPFSVIPPFTGIPTNLTEPYDLASMIADMNSGRRPGNNPDGEPGVRVGNNPGDHMSEEIYRGLRNAMQMFRDEDASRPNSQPNNSNGN